MLTKAKRIGQDWKYSLKIILKLGHVVDVSHIPDIRQRNMD
jgi:hypothetical protein